MDTLQHPIYQREEKKNKQIAWISVPVALAILLGLMLYFGLYYTVPPPEEEGLSIQLGIEDGGMNTEYVTDPQSTPEQASSSPQTEENLTQDLDDAPSVNQQNPTQATTTTNTQNPHTPNPSRTFSTDGRNPGGEGDGGNTGNQGSTTGVPDGSPVGQGTGEGGNGLGNRKVTFKFTGTSNCNYDGYVMVKFKVNRLGKVVETKAQLKNSTIQDLTCVSEAEKFAKKWQFEPNSDAPEYQVGELPVYFKRK